MIGRYAIKTVGWIVSKSKFSAWPCNEQSDSIMVFDSARFVRSGETIVYFLRIFAISYETCLAMRRTMRLQISSTLHKGPL